MAEQKINKKVIEVLVKSGALDEFGHSRAQHWGAIERALECASSARKDALSGQSSMFAMFAESNPDSARQETYPDVPEWSEKERLGYERESLGFYLSGHPLDRYVDEATRLGAIPTSDLVNQRHNSEAVCVGIVAGLRERLLKSGNGRWAVITLEDTFGQAEVLAFSRAYEEGEDIIKSGEPLLIKGRALIDDINDEGEQLTPKMRAEEIRSLVDAQIEATRWLDVLVEVPAHQSVELGPGLLDPRDEEVHAADAAAAEAEAMLEQIRDACAMHRGETPTRMTLTMPAGYRVLLECSDDLRVHPGDDLIQALERIKGVAQVARR